MAEKGFKRKLTAILSADVEGYSRLMGDDEEATVRTLTAYREVLTTLIQQHNGKVLDSPCDNPNRHQPWRCHSGRGANLWGWRQHCRSTGRIG